MDEAILRHGWLFLLFGTLLNIPLLWRRARPHISIHPELAAGYRRLIWWSAFWMSLPWLVLGFGCEVGGLTFLHFLSPVVGGLFVWVFYAVIFTELITLAYWVLFRRGAETLHTHSALFNFPTGSVRQVQWSICGVVVLGLIVNTIVPLLWMSK